MELLIGTKASNQPEREPEIDANVRTSKATWRVRFERIRLERTKYLPETGRAFLEFCVS